MDESTAFSRSKYFTCLNNGFIFGVRGNFSEHLCFCYKIIILTWFNKQRHYKNEKHIFYQTTQQGGFSKVGKRWQPWYILKKRNSLLIFFLNYKSEIGIKNISLRLLQIFRGVLESWETLLDSIGSNYIYTTCMLVTWWPSDFWLYRVHFLWFCKKVLMQSVWKLVSILFKVIMQKIQVTSFSVLV